MHSLLHDIVALLSSCTVITVQHLHRETNSIADWITFYIIEYSEVFLWIDLEEVPGQLRNIVLSNFLGCIHTRFL